MKKSKVAKVKKAKKPERVELRIAVDVPEGWTKAMVRKEILEQLTENSPVVNFGKVKVQFV